MTSEEYRSIRFPAKRRGAPLAPPNRFERYRYENEETEPLGEGEQAPVRAQYLPDDSRSIITENDSPDVGFRYSVNPYRGCEHGCPYCYARPTHETLGFNAGIEFETRILVKYRAPELLRAALSSPRWQPEPLAFSGVTDCYQPIERRLCLTRSCLEVCAEFRQPVAVVTKNRLVTRDRDILGPMGRERLARVVISVTTLDRELCHELEPRASLPEQRLEAIATLAESGVDVVVLVAPVIPGLNDHEIPAILRSAAEAGARGAGYVLLRLPGAVKDVFTDWLERVFPLKKETVLSRIRACRGGRLNDTAFGRRMRGQGPLADAIEKTFRVACRRYGLDKPLPPLDCTRFRVPGRRRQRSLFD